MAQMAAPGGPSAVADPAAAADIRGRLQAVIGPLPSGTVDPATLDKQAVADQLISGYTSLILAGLNRAG